MESVVEGTRGIGDDPLDVGRVGLHEVHGGDVVNRLPILVDEEVEGHAVLAQVLHVDQWGEDVLAELVVDQNLVCFFVRRSARACRLVQVQHSRDAF